MDEYFEWLKQLVSYPNTNVSFDNLFKTLHNRIFIYTIPMDENRYMDGLQLRYRFFLRTGINVMDDRRPCSMLEMMAALSWRIEEDIMDNPVIGNRTPQWFWHMIAVMGLNGQYDGNFNEDENRRLRQAMAVLEKYKDNLFLVRMPNPTIALIKTIIRENCLTRGIEYVAYDYIFIGPALLAEFKGFALRNDK